jgi:hypothetical protein
LLEATCSNCWRNHYATNDPTYTLQFTTISSFNFRKKRSPLQLLKSSNSQTNAVDHILCDQCLRFLSKDITSTPFRFDQWEGHILTWVQKQCFSYESIHSDPRSPFDALKPLSVLKKFCSLYPEYNLDPARSYHDAPCAFFGYSEVRMRHLFSPQRSPTVYVCPSIKDVLVSNESSINYFDGKNIIICLASSIPENFSNNDDDGDSESTLVLGNNIFELRYISLFESNTFSLSRSKWNCECYTRHSGEYTSWWHQERGDHMATKYLGNIAIDLPQRSARDTHFSNCTYVYVK